MIATFLSYVPMRAWYAVAALGVVVAAYVMGYVEGQADAKHTVLTQTVEVYRDANKIDNKVRAMPDGAAARDLKLHWSRD